MEEIELLEQPKKLPTLQHYGLLLFLITSLGLLIFSVVLSATR